MWCILFFDRLKEFFSQCLYKIKAGNERIEFGAGYHFVSR